MNKKLNPFVIAVLDAAIHGTICPMDYPRAFCYANCTGRVMTDEENQKLNPQELGPGYVRLMNCATNTYGMKDLAFPIPAVKSGPPQ